MAFKILVGIVVVLVIAGGGLAYYGSTVKPQQKQYEQVLPDDRFEK